MGKLALIEEMQDTVDRLTMSAQNAKAEYDAKKKLLEQAEKRLSSLIRLGEKALLDQTPLFPEEGTAEAKADKATAKKPTKKEANAAAIAADAGEVKPSKAWREMPIKAAISLVSVGNALEVFDPPVTTLLELKHWLTKHQFTDLKGVGADKAAKAADQLAEFRKAHPEFVDF